MTLHGADWFIPEHAKFYDPMDVRYIRLVMPLYCRRSSLLISVSQLTTDNFVKLLRLPPEKVKTVYIAPGKHFRRVTDPERLRQVKAKYQLPDRFIFTLSGYRPRPPEKHRPHYRVVPALPWAHGSQAFGRWSRLPSVPG